MAKVEDFNFQYDLQLQEFKDRVRSIINDGKFQYQVVKSPPTWTGKIGESVLLMPDSGGTCYYYFHGTAWVSGWTNNI